MLHPTAKIRLITVRQLYLHALIEFFLRILSALFTAGVDDMTITFHNHLSLSMTRVTLHCLNVATG